MKSSRVKRKKVVKPKAFKARMKALSRKRRLSLSNPNLTQAQYEKLRSDQRRKPNPDWFDTHHAYIEALMEWKLGKELRRSKAEVKNLEREHAQVWRKYRSRSKQFLKVHPDFEKVLSKADKISLSPLIPELILRSKVGPAIAYWLCKHRRELAKINKLTPLGAAREIGKLEAKLSAT